TNLETTKIPAGDTIIVDRPRLRIVFSTTGGAIKSFLLKDYRIDIVPEGKFLFTTVISDSIYQFEPKLFPDSVVFTKKIGEITIYKRYFFEHENGFNLKISSDTLIQILSLKDGLAITEKKNQSEDLRHFDVYVQDYKFNRVTPNIKTKLEYKTTWNWLALRNKYFVLIINNLGVIENTFFHQITSLFPKSGIAKSYLGCGVRSNVNRFGVEIYGKNEINISIFLLPLQYSLLVQYKKGYEQIASGGFWGPIARLILVILKFFYSLVKNYGIVVIIFAVLLKVVFFPLSKQVFISQQRMQLLQPELKKLQQKYKNDPQTLNQEMMHLYKVYKINPFSGCLPLLIQFPVFIALYQVLSTSIEFRQAPFVLWITDLSLKDPYYVLPIGMGIMMLIQSLMTTVDPRQKFMVIMMPIVMIFVFLNFPSGLQLYWFTYNILSIIEQFIIKKYFIALVKK
ncbi:MAG: membrane protein insertase YidC, partial [candidate division WOR-3 bacterium]